MTTSPAARIGAVIRQHRLANGVTQQTLAGMLDVSQATVSAWEKGLYEPSLVTLARLSALLDIPTDAWIDALEDGDAA